MKSFLVALFLLTAVVAATGGDYPIRLVPFSAVDLRDRFWAPRLETNRTATIAHNLAEMEKQGSVDGFRRLAGDDSIKYHGYMWGDSDLYKTLEGMVYSLQQKPDTALEIRLEELINLFSRAQAPDGYLFPHLQVTEPQYQHFTDEGSLTCESYSIGHLIESAAEHYRLTGRTNYLAVATRAADLLEQVHAGGKLLQTSGHPEVELALVKLYRVTGRQQYLDLAASLIRHARQQTTAWSQGKPPLGHDDPHGHAVAMFYLYAAATDVAMLKNDRPLLEQMFRKWERMVGGKMYLTGAVGHRQYSEGFGPDYDLPNDANAYCETCAGLAGIFWQERLFQASGEARYFDIIERTLYNQVAAGAGLSGDRFFYVNPLATDGKRKFNHGLATRFAWTGCPCCPVNLVRFWPRLPEYAYATGSSDLYLNLYVESEARLILNGMPVKVIQKTDYPWDGRVSIELVPEKPAAFALRLRIPGWAVGKPVPSELYRYVDSATEPVVLRLNGAPLNVPREKGYAVVDRTWRTGDRVELVLQMPVRRVLAHDQVGANKGRVAVERGPLVYCAEGVDNAGKALDLVLPDAAVLHPERRPGWLNGPTVLKSEAGSAHVTLVPYYAWNYRGEGEMSVWLVRNQSVASP